MGKYKEEFSIILLSVICSLFALVYIFYAAVQKKFGAILPYAIKRGFKILGNKNNVGKKKKNDNK